MGAADKKPVLLIVGLYSYGTGFTNVLENLCAEWHQRYAIHWLGIGYSGEVLHTNHYTLYPNNIRGGDMYGAYEAANMAIALKVDCIFILNDLYMFKNYRECLSPLKEKKIKLIGYIPLDGYITDPSIVLQTTFLDTIVLYAQWAKEELLNAFEKLGLSNIPECVVIPHGVDTTVFAKANDDTIQHFKKQLFPSITNADEAIFILNANRNAERKNIHATLEAFAMSLPYFTSSVYLCLHQPSILFEQREALQKQIKSLGLEHCVRVNPLGEAYIHPEQLSRLYQCCSIGVNTSFGEGWGLISFEHAACGAAQIVPVHTTPGEVWKDVGICIPNDHSVQLSSNPFLMYQLSTAILSKELIHLVNDKNYLEKISTQCLEYSKLEKFNWSSIASEWNRVLS